MWNVEADTAITPPLTTAQASSSPTELEVEEEEDRLTPQSRHTSVLATQVSPGDHIIAIDDEDVSQKNVKEITTIMARDSEFERVLTLFEAPKIDVARVLFMKSAIQTFEDEG